MGALATAAAPRARSALFLAAATCALLLLPSPLLLSGASPASGCPTHGGGAFVGPPLRRSAGAAAARPARTSKAPADGGLPQEGGSPGDDETQKVVQVIMNLASFVFWAIYIRGLVVEDHCIAPKLARDIAIVQGLGGEIFPLFPQQ
mmetsp:Transcript_40775/g.115649  ORF Transcript_40775/g.115649 Transcript_40775/m.115649 type:complete len:147 (+) Transcript_40775:79-519(+)